MVPNILWTIVTLTIKMVQNGRTFYVMAVISNHFTPNSHDIQEKDSRKRHILQI